MSTEHGMLILNLQICQTGTKRGAALPPAPPPPLLPLPLAPLGPPPPAEPEGLALGERWEPAADEVARGGVELTPAGAEGVVEDDACATFCIESGSTRSESERDSQPERKSNHAAVAPPDDADSALDASVIRVLMSARKTLSSVACV